MPFNKSVGDFDRGDNDAFVCNDDTDQTVNVFVYKYVCLFVVHSDCSMFVHHFYFTVVFEYCMHVHEI